MSTESPNEESAEGAEPIESPEVKRAVDDVGLSSELAEEIESEDEAAAADSSAADAAGLETAIQEEEIAIEEESASEVAVSKEPEPSACRLSSARNTRTSCPGLAEGFTPSILPRPRTTSPTGSPWRAMM